MLKTRLWSAVAMLLVMLGVLYTQNPWPWWLFVMVCAAVALWEWARLFGLDHRSAIAYSGFVVLLGLGATRQDSDVVVFWLCLGVWWWWCLVPIAVLKARGLGLSRSVGTRIKWPVLALHMALGALWVWAAAVVLILAKQQSVVLLLSFLAVCWVADVAAYACGKRWGKHKLALRVSPGKSWEGAVGGLVIVLAMSFTLVALAAYYPMLASTWQVQVFYAIGPWGLGLASVLLASVAVLGDLYESLLKRQRGVKDSSQLLPGHGGVLDRIDAQLPVLPMAWLMWFAATHSTFLPNFLNTGHGHGVL